MLYTLSELVDKLAGMRDKTIVHCHGCFDILHFGHIKHLEEAKSLGDFLVVTVTPDGMVNKGHGRPVFTHDVRAEVLAAVRWVDAVAVNEWPTAVETIKLLRPHYYVKGLECRKNKLPGLLEEENAIRSVGGQVAFTSGIVFSSTELVQKVIEYYG